MPCTGRRILVSAALPAGLLAAAIGAGALFVTTMPGRSFEGALPALSEEQSDLAQRLEGHVRALAGEIGERNLFRYPALIRAAEYIEASFVSAGLEPDSQTYQVQGKAVRNIEVEIPGVDADAGIVVGAHYDSVHGSPGANDNATGVAAVLELTRAFQSRALCRPLRLVAFVNEEPPFCYTDAMGSVRYAERASERGEKIEAMLSLETIGYYTDVPGSQRYPFPLSLFYPDTGNFVGFVGNLKSKALVRRAVGTFRNNAGFPSEGLAAPGWIRGVGWSDHWSFWRAGYRAAMVTDTALFRYREYHTPADRPDVVHYPCFSRVVDGLVSVLMDLAGGEVTE